LELPLVGMTGNDPATPGLRDRYSAD